jgi:hypothetical protein
MCLWRVASYEDAGAAVALQTFPDLTQGSGSLSPTQSVLDRKDLSGGRLPYFAMLSFD